jgi:hypothetical protein
MTGPAAPHGTASTLPPPSANGSAPPHPVPQPPGRGQLQTPDQRDAHRADRGHTPAIAERQSATDPLSAHPPRQMTREKTGEPPMSAARKRASGSVLGIRSWRHRVAGHVLRQRVEVSDDDRTVATAEVTTFEGSGGTARVSLRAEPGHITPGRRASLVDAVLDLPEVQQSARLEAAFRLGDGESLHQLQERCEDVSTRPAGWSALLDADLPSSRAGQPVPDSAGKESLSGA